MGDRVACSRTACCSRSTRPRNLYDRPDNVFVAGFIGSPAMNLVDVDLTEQGAHRRRRPSRCRGTTAQLAAEGATTATLGFRPESVEVVGEGEGFPFEVSGGRGTRLRRLRLRHPAPRPTPPPDDKMFIARVDARRPTVEGRDHPHTDPGGEEHVFNPDTGERVGGAAAAHTSV